MTPLRRAAELAEEHLAGLAGRRVGALTTYEDTVAALDEPLPEEGADPVAVIERLAPVAGPATRARPRPGHRRQPRPALLRLRHRGRAAGGPGGRLAHLGLGPERVQPRQLPGRRGD